MTSAGDASKTRKAEQRDSTRAALVAAARELFTSRGFADTPTEEIVRVAGVTRGALYHHFPTKEALFRAVVEEVQREITERVAVAAVSAGSVWDGILAGCDAFLDACMDPAAQRLCLVDGPAVLGAVEWRELESTCGIAITKVAIDKAIEEGLIEPQPSETLARLVFGALNRAALHLARTEDRTATRAHVGAAVRTLLEGLRVSGEPRAAAS